MRKMYLHKKLFVLGLSVTLVTNTLVACSSNSNNTNSEASDIKSTEISEEVESSGSLYARVQSIDGNSITAVKGELNTDVGDNQTPPSGDSATPPEMPADNSTGDSANAPSNDSSTPPEMPANNGTGTEGNTPPSDGSAPPDMPSKNPGGSTTFVEGTDTITFTITNDTAITVEFLQGSQEGTIDNITVNSVLELTLDENNNATSIVVKNLQSGGGFGGSSTVTNGTSANTIDSDSEIANEKYTSTSDDENALRVNGATVSNCDITISDVALTLANDNLLTVAGNSSSRGWGTEGSNGGNVNFNAESQTMEGNITCDSISTLNMTMKNQTNFKGTVNKAGEAGTVSVTIDADSTWTLTGDSYISSFDGDFSSVNTNGYHLYVNGEQVA